MTTTPPATSVLQAFLDAFNAHDVDAIMSFFAEDCVLEMPRGPAPGGRRLVGREQVREGIQSRLDGIPDVHLSASDGTRTRDLRRDRPRRRPRRTTTHDG
jgi:ketosteroid isomerase-like protein